MRKKTGKIDIINKEKQTQKRYEMESEQTLMIPKSSFAARLWERVKKSEYLYLVAAFFLPFMIMLGIYACLEVHPFGNNSVLTLDLQAQYIYYYEEIRNLLVNGGSWLYSWKRTLGGEFMGIVAYYMGSPFNGLLVLFPKANIADAVMFIQMCKIGTMGVNFGYYLHKTRHPGEMRTIAFSVMYALCAFSTVQTINPMWLDAVVFLPMLILGVERLIKHKRCVLYIISLSIIFVSNYYMGYMCGIFTFLYFLYYYFTVRPEIIGKYKVDKADFAIKRFVSTCGFKTFVRFAVATLIALAISAFMLYPAWYSLQFGKVGFTTPNFELKLRFDFFDLFVKMLAGSYDSVNVYGTPMVYCGVLTLVLLPLFYISKSVPKRQKIAATGLLLVLLASFFVNTIDLVWHGFNAPNWLNYRYSYVFSFFVLTLACDAMKGISKIKLPYVIGSGVAVAVLIIITQKLDITFKQGDSKTISPSAAGCILLSFAFVVAYTIIVTFIRKKKTREAAAFVLAAFVCVECFVSSLLSIDAVHDEVGLTRYSDYADNTGNEVYSSYTGSIIRIRDVVDEVLDGDDSFYRMESMVYRKLGGVNEPMAFGYNGISHSTSTLNADIIRMMNKMGYSSSSHWTKYIGGTPVSDALLGIKYVITENDTLDNNIYTVAAHGKEGYQVTVSNDTIYAMRNTKALSIAYGVSESVLNTMDRSTYLPYTSALEFQNKLIRSMLSETSLSGDVLKGISTGIDTKNCTRSTFSQTHKYYVGEEEVSVNNSYYSFTKTGSNPTVIFDFTAPASGPIYFHFNAANYGKTFKVYLNGSSSPLSLNVGNQKDYFGIETSCIVKLGTFEKGDEVTVELAMNDDNLYLSKESKYFFYYVDYSQLNEAISLLEDAEMEVEKFGNDYLKGNIYLPEGQTLIFTTIPYDAGWNVYIDGKKAETVKAMDSLLAVKSTEGYHEITFRYMPRGYVLSFIISGIAIAAMIAYLVILLLQRAGKVKILKSEESVLCASCPDMIFRTEDVESEPDTGEDVDIEEFTTTDMTDAAESGSSETGAESDNTEEITE